MTPVATPGTPQLQWGRDLIVAETAVAALRFALDQRFNGAAT